MSLKVVILTASILKVVAPEPEDPLYVFRDPTCELEAGSITVTVIDLLPIDPTERVGYLKQGETTCDVLELVYPGV